MQIIIDLPKEIYKAAQIIGGKFDDVIQIPLEVIANCTPIPDNATNGEVVKTLFSNTFDNFCERTTWEWNRWWNTPYQKGE